MSCDYVTLRAVHFCKEIFEYFGLIVPVLLIVLVSIDLGKMVISGDADTKKTLKSIIGRIIAAVACYFVPIIVTLLVGILADSDDKMKNNGGIFCWNEATDEQIEKLKAAYEAEKKAEEQKRAAEKKKKADEKAAIRKAARDAKKKVDQIIPTVESSTKGATVVRPYINGVEATSGIPKGKCMTWEENCACPSLSGGKISGFTFILKSETAREFAEVRYIDGSDNVKGISVSCPDGSTIIASVYSGVASNFESAFKKICQLKTTGINGYKVDANNVVYCGSYVKRLNAARDVCSPHTYGLAVDFNPGLSIGVGGTSYKPYSGQGIKTRNEYDKFITALGGRENDVRNVNYILWKYAFEPSGFEWGGTWNAGSFDPMHYEVRIGR